MARNRWNGGLYKACSCREPNACGHPWRTRYVVGRSAINTSTGEPDFASAMAVAVSMRESAIRHYQTSGVSVGRGMTIAELSRIDVKRRIGKGARDPSETEKTVRSRWAPILRYFNGRAGKTALVSDLTYQSVEEYKLHRIGDGIRGQTVSRELASIRGTLEYSERMGLTSHHLRVWPDHPKRSPKDPGRAGRRLDLGVLSEFLGRLSERNQWAADSMVFAAWTGVRTAELTRIEWRDIQKGAFGYTLRLREEVTKTGVEREIPLGRIPYNAALRCHQRALGGQIFYPKCFKDLRAQVCKEMGLDHSINVRDLRKTMASVLSELSRNGARVAQQILGHAKLSTTQHYLEANPATVAAAMEDLDDALEGAIWQRAG